MRALAPLVSFALLATAIAPAPAMAACAQDAAGRCEAKSAACHPPADGRCETVRGYTLSNLQYACRCMSPQLYGPQASAGSSSCRQNCSASEITCESRARNATQRNNCVSRNGACNGHCR
jgi:hypothetical protein